MIAIPIAVAIHYIPMLISLSSAFIFSAISLWFNRRGRVNIASLITVGGMGFALGSIAAPGGLSLDNLQTFDLLVEIELLTVSLFPPARPSEHGMIQYDRIIQELKEVVKL